VVVVVIGEREGERVGLVQRSSDAIKAVQAHYALHPAIATTSNSRYNLGHIIE
jgi:hypothetical protein